MELSGRVSVVTGAASGIGRALCRRFAREGARGVVVADIDAEGARTVADEIGGLAVATDVSRESEIQKLVASALERYGAIDLFCSNAGVAVAGGPDAPDADWQQSFDVNFMSHVWAARAVLPAMLARGEGWLMCTASAAGLLSQIGSAPYTVTKHAAVAFAEWLAITYGDRGIHSSCLCPQGVRTGMLNEHSGPAFLLQGAIEPDVVADHVVRALRDDRFLILPHPEVAEYVRRKAEDPERWLAGMRRLAAKLGG